MRLCNHIVIISSNVFIFILQLPHDTEATILPRNVPVFGSTEFVNHDHHYTRKNKLPDRRKTVAAGSMVEIPQPHKVAEEHVGEPGFSVDQSYQDDMLSDKSSEASGSLYCPDDFSDVPSDDMSIECDEDTQAGKGRCFIVFESELVKLFGKCSICGSVVVSRKDWTTGSMVTFKMECIEGHETTWRSQPMIHGLPIGNLLVGAAILFTGLTYARIAAFSAALNLVMFNKSTFYRTQRTKLFPVVQEAWQEQQDFVIADLQAHKQLILAGDGRCDSPGHSAKYGTYTLMQADSSQQHSSQKVVDFQLVQCTEVQYTGN